MDRTDYLNEQSARCEPADEEHFSPIRHVDTIYSCLEQMQEGGQ